MNTNSVSKNCFFAALLTFTACLMVMKLGGAETTPGSKAPKSWTNSRASQIVFFAVLEGLYRDGVSNTDLDVIIPPGKDGKPTFEPENFVYACPLCHPAFEAFRLYYQRDMLFGFKGRIDTFGPGLDPVVRGQLHSPDASIRRQAVEGLISRWVAERLELMRLTDAERKSITDEMELARKQGMGALKKDAAGNQSRTNCPICDGSFGACKLRAR